MINAHLTDHRSLTARNPEVSSYILSLRRLTLDLSIGVNPEERQTPTSLVIDVRMEIPVDDTDLLADDYGAVPCYAAVAANIRSHITPMRVQLIETVAQRIINLCLEDRRIAAVWVRVRKIGIVNGCHSVGVELSHRR